MCGGGGMKTKRITPQHTHPYTHTPRTYTHPALHRQSVGEVRTTQDENDVKASPYMTVQRPESGHSKMRWAWNGQSELNTRHSMGWTLTGQQQIDCSDHQPLHGTHTAVTRKPQSQNATLSRTPTNSVVGQILLSVSCEPDRKQELH